MNTQNFEMLRRWFDFEMILKINYNFLKSQLKIQKNFILIFGQGLEYKF
jgi:hypothetical protein